MQASLEFPYFVAVLLALRLPAQSVNSPAPSHRHPFRSQHFSGIVRGSRSDCQLPAIVVRLWNEQIQQSVQQQGEEAKLVWAGVAMSAAESMQKEFDAIKSSITDVITTALFDGGKAGSKKRAELIKASESTDQKAKPTKEPSQDGFGFTDRVPRKRGRR